MQSALLSRAMPAGCAPSTSGSRAAVARVVRAQAAATADAAVKPPKESRVGKAPIPVPSGTNVTLETAYIKVKVRMIAHKREKTKR